MPLTRFPVLRVLRLLGILSPVPAVIGGMAHMNFSKNGLLSNLIWRIPSQMVKLRFLFICRKPKILNLRGMGTGNTYCHTWAITELFTRSRGLLEATLEQFIVCHFKPFQAIGFIFLIQITGNFTRNSQSSFPYSLSGSKGGSNNLFSWLCPRRFHLEWPRSPKWFQHHSLILSLVKKTAKQTFTIYCS